MPNFSNILYLFLSNENIKFSKAYSRIPFLCSNAAISTLHYIKKIPFSNKQPAFELICKSGINVVIVFDFLGEN